MKMNKLNLLLGGNLVLVLGISNWIVQQKEGLLENGRVVLLSVERTDSVSLMQGRYVDLHYPICEIIHDQLEEDPERDGALVLALDKHSVGTFRRLHKEGETLALEEQLLRYKVRGQGNRIRVAAGSFFFQEGMQKEYERARFAELRVDAEGNTLLVALRDQDYKVIGGQRE